MHNVLIVTLVCASITSAHDARAEIPGRSGTMKDAQTLDAAGAAELLTIAVQYPRVFVKEYASHIFRISGPLSYYGPSRVRPNENVVVVQLGNTRITCADSKMNFPLDRPIPQGRTVTIVARLMGIPQTGGEILFDGCLLEQG